MDYLEIINAQGSILANIESMKITLEEIRIKKPESDYVQGLEKHIRQMREAYFTFKFVHQQFELMQKMNFNYHKENMELRYEMEKLKEINTNLMNGI